MEKLHQINTLTREPSGSLFALIKINTKKGNEIKINGWKKWKVAKIRARPPPNLSSEIKIDKKCPKILKNEVFGRFFMGKEAILTKCQ